MLPLEEPPHVAGSGQGDGIVRQQSEAKFPRGSGMLGAVERVSRPAWGCRGFLHGTLSADENHGQPGAIIQARPSSRDGRMLSLFQPEDRVLIGGVP